MSVFARLQPLSDAPDERRRAPRLILRLGTTVGSGAPALIHDISTKGLLFETMDELADDRIHVHLPEAPAAAARVVWSHGRFYGCEFEQPIPGASVSAALLQSEPRQVANDDSAAIAPEPRSRGEWFVPAVLGALLVGGAAWLIASGHFITLAAIGVGALVALALLGALMLWVLDNTPSLKL